MEALVAALLGKKPSNGKVFQLALEYVGAPKSPREPGLAGALDILRSAAFLTYLIGGLVHTGAQWNYASRKRAIEKLLNGFHISRPVVTLTEREKALIRGAAGMYADGGLDLMDWHAFMTLMTWAGGAARVAPPDTGRRGDEHAAEAREFLSRVVATILPNHDQHLADTAARLARYKSHSAKLGRLIAESLTQGARWFEPTDLTTSAVYSATPSAPALMLGTLGDQPLFLRGTRA